MNKVFQFAFLLTLGAFTIFTSCEKDNVNVTEDVEFFVNSSVWDLEERGNCGQHGCYEFVFPITIEFENGDTVSVDDYESLHTVIRDWKEANPDATERPTFVFPLEVLDENGEIISVASQDELIELGKECRRDFFKNKRHKRGEHRGEVCFILVFPLDVTLPDGTVVTVNNRLDLKEKARAWKEANPDSEEHPSLVFPITVEYADGTQVEVNSIDDLQTLKDECAADGE